MAGLEETSLYTVQVEFRVSDTYKYRFVNGEWRTSQRTEKLSSSPILYEHTDSPNFGHHWVKDSIAFGKLKLTNNENSKSADAVYLRSLNKYDPVIHIYKHDKKNVDDKKDFTLKLISIKINYVLIESKIQLFQHSTSKKNLVNQNPLPKHSLL